MIRPDDKEKLSSKTVLVFGASGLIGKHVSRLVLEAGCKLVAVDKEVGRKLDFEDEYLRANEGRLLVEQSDVTDEFSLKKLLEKSLREFGAIDTVVNCATYSSENSLVVTARVEDYDFKEWRRMISVNLDAAFLIAKVFGSYLAHDRGGGSLVYFSSIYGFLGTDHEIYEAVNSPDKRMNNPAAYSASKGGVINLTRYLATYWGEKNVRVNTISLGGIRNGQEELFVESYSKRVPLRRMGELSDLDSTIKFLIIEDTGYFTGQNLVIDGGLSAW